MSLIVQFQCLFYSFLFGFVMTGVYHIMNRLLYGVPMFLRYICQCLIGICFGMLYFYGLVFLNEGILRLYFFIFMLMGYLLYSHYYAYYLLYFLEKIVSNGIIQKRIGRMKRKWQKRKHQDIKNS